MSIENSDLMLIQRGNQPYRETVENLSTKVRGDLDVTAGGDIPIASASQLGVIRVGANLDIDGNGILSAVIPAGMTYKGVWSDVDNPPATPGNGDFYIWDGAGGNLNNALWGSSNGEAVVEGDRIFYSTDDSWQIISSGGGGGLAEVTGTAPIVVSPISDGEQDISISEVIANGTAGAMSGADKAKLDGIAAGAEVNVAPTQTYTAAAANGTLTLSGGDTTVLPAATDSEAGLMTAADKAQLDSLVATPGGVLSVTARNGITNNGTAGAPILDVDFGALPNGDAATAQVMPYDISSLGVLP